MSKYAAKVEDGVVVQAIVGDAAWAATRLGGVWHDAESKVGIGWTFTAEDGFRPPCPFPSWTWSDGGWVAPTPMPDDGIYLWDEDAQEWVSVDV